MEESDNRKILRPPFPQIKKYPNVNPVKPKFQLAMSDIAVHQVNLTQAEIQHIFGLPFKIQKLSNIPKDLLRAGRRLIKKPHVPPAPIQEEGPTCKKLKLAISSSISGGKQTSWARKGMPPHSKNPGKGSETAPLVVKKEDITIFKKRENEGDEYINWLKAQAPNPPQESEDKPDSKFSKMKTCDFSTAISAEVSSATGDDKCMEISGDFNPARVNKKLDCDDNDETWDGQTDPSSDSYYRRLFSIAFLIPAICSIMLVFKLGRK